MRLPILTLPILLLATAYLDAQSLRINEFMADPTPAVGLPAAEFIELQNTSTRPLDLSTLRVASGGRAVDAGAGSVPLAAGGFLVLVPEASAADFSSLGGRVVPMRLPGLTNDGDEITVLLGTDTVAHLRYEASWYGDAARDGGGFSLEYNGLGDPTCGGNWRASLDPAGGTPGYPNSIAGQRIDSLAPTLTATAIDSGGIDLNFSEPVAGPVFVSVNGSQTEALAVAQKAYRVVTQIEKGAVYELRVFADYADCAGNYPPRDTVLTLLYADPPVAGQLLINELLFDPSPGSSDFLEVYNNSLKIFDLRGITVSNSNGNSRSRTLGQSFILRPGEYAVLTPDPVRLLVDFPAARSERIVAFDLPAFPNRSGNVTLTAPSGSDIDSYDYSEDQHSELLSTVEGVSLERVDPNEPTNAPGNWASAASTAGFGTPTLPNSQRGELATSAQIFQLETTTRTFSPDGDGIEDRFVIIYDAAKSGSFAQLHVFDLDGRPVSSDPAPILLGRTGELMWDGSDADGALVAPGPYVVLVDLFTEDGHTHREKLVAVVAPSR